MVKRLGSKVKLFVFTILILIITIEMLSFIATKLNLLMANEEPGYFYPSGDKWRTETMSWGRGINLILVTVTERRVLMLNMNLTT